MSTRSTGSTSSRVLVRDDARRSRRQELSRRRPARGVLRALGARQRRRLHRPVAARGQLDAAERLRLPRHAPHREPRRLPAASPRRASRSRLRSPTTSCRTRCSSRRGWTTTRSRRASGIPRSASSGSTTSLASASRSCRRRSTGRPTGSRRRACRSRAAGTARSTRPTTRSSTRSTSTRPTTVAWLRSAAVRYVLLSTTAPLDWEGGPQEARIVRSPRSGLKAVFRSRNWTIYELPHATPLLTGPAHPVVTAFGHTAIRGRGLRGRALPPARPLQPVPAPDRAPAASHRGRTR